MNIFRLTIKALDKSKLPLEKKLKMEKEAETMIQLFMRNKEKPRPTPNTPPKKPTYQLHEGVDFDHNDKVGRFAKAKGKINAGSTVVVEKPHCSMLLENKRQSHCHNCFKRVIAPLCCPNCQEALFCGETCRDKALKSYHKVECRILPTLYASGLSIICFLALRILSQKSVKYFEDFLKEIGGDTEIDFDQRLQ